jgi:hypothetical protein
MNKWLLCSMIIWMFILIIQHRRNQIHRKANHQAGRGRSQTLMMEPQTNFYKNVLGLLPNRQIIAQIK